MSHRGRAHTGSSPPTLPWSTLEVLAEERAKPAEQRGKIRAPDEVVTPVDLLPAALPRQVGQRA
jgi:hypothetical protein